jgi:hypothetical protein
VIIPDIMVLFYVGLEPLNLFVELLVLGWEKNYQVFLETAYGAGAGPIIFELSLLVS